MNSPETAAFASSDGLTELAVTDAAELLASKKLSPVELARAHLDRIASINDKVKGYITVTGDRALSKAREAEAEIMAGRYKGPLHGIPYGLKDNYYTKGIRTTFASRLYWDWVPDADSTVHARLEAAGAVSATCRCRRLRTRGTRNISPAARAPAQAPPRRRDCA